MYTFIRNLKGPPVPEENVTHPPPGKLITIPLSASTSPQRFLRIYIYHLVIKQVIAKKKKIKLTTRYKIASLVRGLTQSELS